MINYLVHFHLEMLHTNLHIYKDLLTGIFLSLLLYGLCILFSSLGMSPLKHVCLLYIYKYVYSSTYLYCMYIGSMYTLCQRNMQSLGSSGQYSSEMALKWLMYTALLNPVCSAWPEYYRITKPSIIVEK